EERGGLGRIAAEYFRHPERVVEANEPVGDDEAALRQVASRGRQADGGLQRRGVVVREIPDDRLVERLRLVEADDPAARANERVAAKAPVLDRLEQERRPAGGAQPEICRERGEEICGDDGRSVHVE